MALSETDRKLLDRCLERKPRAWEDFVDRYTGLVIHVINHSSQARSIRLSAEDREDLCADVFLALIKKDFAVLRRFRGQSSLPTYLTVVARRIVVKKLLTSKSPARLAQQDDYPAAENGAQEDRVHDRDEVERLLEDLEGHEAQVVRLFHIEGKTYHEISTATGMPENSIGPTLSRARDKLRRSTADPATE